MGEGGPSVVPGGAAACMQMLRSATPCLHVGVWGIHHVSSTATIHLTGHAQQGGHHARTQAGARLLQDCVSCAAAAACAGAVMW
jgi:hypothetical protein